MKSQQTVILVVGLIFAAIVVFAIMNKQKREVVQMPISEAPSGGGGMDMGALLGMVQGFM